MSPNRDGTTRRRLLKSIGATGLAFGAVGSASAADVPTGKLNRVETAYETPARARWAASQHADPVLAELADRGVLERDDVAELDFEDVETKGVYKDGEAVAHVATETEFDGSSVEFAVRPETGRAYATVRTDGGDVYTVESAAGDDDVTTQGECWYEHKCESVACSSGGGCLYLERECCCQDGTTGLSSDDVGTTCNESCTDWYEDGCCTC